jgi:biotin operon repressor
VEGMSQKDRSYAGNVVEIAVIRSEGAQNDWLSRAQSAYAAAEASAVDAYMHYHAAATAILEGQSARKLAGEKALSQEEIGSRLGIGQPAVSKLLTWERKFGAQMEANIRVPVPSPYYLPPPPTPQQQEDKKKRKAATRATAAEIQQQYQVVLRENEANLSKLAAENEAKDARIAELEAEKGATPDFFVPPPQAETEGDDEEFNIEDTIKALLAKLPTTEDQLDVLARVEAWINFERGGHS